VTFFAATGRPYWRSCQGPIPDLAGWQQEILAPRVPPTARAMEVGLALPPGYDAVLARALSPNPAERHGSIAELAGALATAAHVGVVPAVGQAAPAVQIFQAGQAVQAVEPPIDGPPRSKAGLWIGLSLGAVALIGGVIAIVAMRAKAPSASSAGAAPSSSSSLAAAVASSAPSASGAASVAVASEATPDAAIPPAAAQPESETEAAAPEAAQLTVVCMPDCDTVTLDDDVLDAGLSDPQSLPAGVHTIVVTKATYLSQTRKVTLKAGQKEKASFFLARPGPAPAKQCGKFLQRCP